MQDLNQGNFDILVGISGSSSNQYLAESNVCTMCSAHAHSHFLRIHCEHIEVSKIGENHETYGDEENTKGLQCVQLSEA